MGIFPRQNWNPVRHSMARLTGKDPQMDKSAVELFFFLLLYLYVIILNEVIQPKKRLFILLPYLHDKIPNES